MYQRIDMHVGPTLRQARLERVSVCSCGFKNCTAEVGKIYDVDMDSVRWVRLVCKGCGKLIETRVIDVWQPFCAPQWFPLEMLDVDREIPYVHPIGTSWKPVNNNMVAPKVNGPRILYGD